MRLLSSFLRLSSLFRRRNHYQQYPYYLTTMSASSPTTGTPTSTGPTTTAKFQNPKFVPKQVNEYVLKHGYSETSVAEELRIETAKHPRSVMMGDPIEASMFKVLLPAIGAKNVVEVGVFTGYTTLIMAEAMGPEGKIVACDVSDEFTSTASRY